MQTIWGLENLGVAPGPSVATVGVFDGVHIGHQAIMHTVKTAARERSARSVVVTFDRDPEELLRPGLAPRHITSLSQKLDIISDQGIDLVLVIRLTQDLINTTAEDFVSSIVHEGLAAVHVVVGAGFAFGRGRRGTAQLLREMGSRLGFTVAEVPPVRSNDLIVSSTEIRLLLEAGDVERATVLLGRPFTLEGPVVRGDGLGKSLGYPTANIRQSERQIVPASGVYAASVRLRDELLPGVVSIGTRPTVDGRSLSIEVYIVGLSENLYGRELGILFLHRLRSELRFPDMASLRRQIEKDVELAAALMAKQSTLLT